MVHVAQAHAQPCVASQGGFFFSWLQPLWPKPESAATWQADFLSVPPRALLMLTGLTQLDAFGWALVKVSLRREGFQGRWGGEPLCYLQCCWSHSYRKDEVGQGTIPPLPLHPRPE